jgi:hypothetical protein
MRTKISLLFILISCISFKTNAQDLNATVKILTNDLSNPDKALVADLQISIFNFLNNKKWSDDKIQINEKIDCTFIINLKSQNTDNFTATVEIQSSRPVFGSTYNSIIFRHLDNWDFKYSLYLPLDYQESAYTSQLTSLLAFYANLLIGMDYDSYSQDGGLNYYRKAKNIKDLAMNEIGWGIRDGKNSFNRWFLIENLMDERYKTLHTALYIYHIKGMDIMYKDIDKGRTAIIDGLTELKAIYNIYPNSFSLFLFFEAKSKELVKIFTKASPSEKNRAYELLVLLNPYNRNKYDEMLKSN